MAPNGFDYVRLDDLGGVEGFRAAATRHAFPRHAHVETVVGLVGSGTKRFEVGGAVWEAGPGAVFVIPAGCVHTGRSTGPSPAAYRAWMVPPAAGGADETECPPEVPRLLTAGPAERLFVAFDRAAVGGAGLLERHTRLTELLAFVSGPPAPAAPAPVPPHPGLRRAFELINDRYADGLSLAELARAAGLSRFHLVRTFKAAFGLPPHAYQDAVRVRRAKRLLAAGTPIAAAAAAVGYADQAHLTRRMKRLTGVTPGQVARPSNIVQDRPAGGA